MDPLNNNKEDFVPFFNINSQIDEMHNKVSSFQDSLYKRTISNTLMCSISQDSLLRQIICSTFCTVA